MDDSRKKPDKLQNDAYENNDLLTEHQQKLVDKIGEGILGACVTETWGVRQSIINLEKLIDLMRVAEMDGKLNLLDNFDN
jgi:hypothetical protein